MVQALLLAESRREGVESWILWNPQNRYAWSALKTKENLP
jgi:hypothetical protein